MYSLLTRGTRVLVRLRVCAHEELATVLYCRPNGTIAIMLDRCPDLVFFVTDWRLPPCSLEI